MREISFKEALKRLINGEYIMVKNGSEEDMLIKMINDKAELRGSTKNGESILFQLNDFGCECDHYYEVKDDCVYLEIKAKYKGKETIEKYVFLPGKSEEKIIVKMQDLMK